MHLTFFAAIVCMQFGGVRPAALRRWEIADLIYHSYKRTDFKAFEEYPADLFTPLAGPFYRKLSKLAEPEALHIAVNGFRSGSRGVASQIFPDYPWIEMGKFIIYEEHGLTTMHTIAEALPAYLLADDLLQKYVRDVNTPVFLNDEDRLLEEPGRRKNVSKSEFTPEQVIAYTELQRPRYFLAFFVDIYRIAYHLTSRCKNSAQYAHRKDDCASFFFSYSHLLATYTQVICSYLGADSELDVDGICPNLCLVRDAPLWEAVAMSNSSQRLSYLQLPSVHEAVDVCAQIPFAVPGTCRLRGKGIFDHEFTCLCESPAYEWKAESGGLADGLFPRCNPLPEFLKTLRDGEDNSTIACTKEEISTFCNENGTSACYYKVNRTYEGPSDETAVQFIKLSPWPVCRCKEAYGGEACERPRDSCNDPLDLTDHPELKAVIETLPDVPLVLTGNWLCDDHLKDSACIAEPVFFGNTV
ncbi:hypothetical protein SprV_0902670700 [Sparganum proliferum]